MPGHDTLGAVEPSLDLARFAAICADIDAGEPEAQAAKSAGLSLEAWRAAEEAWLCRIAGEAPQARQDLTRRYNEAFSRRRRAQGGRLPGPSPDPSGEEAPDTSAPTPAAGGGPAPGQPAVPSFMRPGAAAGGGAGEGARPAALPSFMRANPPPPPSARLSPEQFAALVAELAVAALPPAEILARYGLDEATHRVEAAAWQLRFAADPASHTRWLALFSGYRDRFSQRR